MNDPSNVLASSRVYPVVPCLMLTIVSGCKRGAMSTALHLPFTAYPPITPPTHLPHQALDLKPNYMRAWTNMGISLANLTDYDASARYYVRALALNPRAAAGARRAGGMRGGRMAGAPGLATVSNTASRAAECTPTYGSTPFPCPTRSLELPAHLADVRGAAGPAARRGCGGPAGAAKGAAAGVSICTSSTAQE